MENKRTGTGMENKRTGTGNGRQKNKESVAACDVSHGGVEEREFVAVGAGVGKVEVDPFAHGALAHDERGGAAGLHHAHEFVRVELEDQAVRAGEGEDLAADG